MSKETKQRITQDGIVQAASEYKEKSYKYDAFISYRHVEPDQSIAQALHEMIETFKAPKEFNTGGRRPRFRVFRDREELAARDLSDSIEDALKNSKYLIVICSKRLKLSEWCLKEIRTFRKLHGDNRIIPLLIEGEPGESFPNELKELKRKVSEEREALLQDILAADIRPDRVLQDDFVGYEELENNDRATLKRLTGEAVGLLKTEKYRIMATILGCSFGDLKQRDKERKNRLMFSIASITAAILLVFGIFMWGAYRKAESARQVAVQSNASILMKTSRDLLNNGDSIKAVLVAQEAMKPIRPDMEHFEALKLQEQAIFNNSIYHMGASMLTTIPTKNKLTFFSLSKDGKYLAYGLGNNELAVSDPENGQLLKTFSGHTEQVKFSAFSPDGTLLVSSSFDQRVIIYDFERGKQIKTLEIPGIPMMTRFSSDGEKLFHISLSQNEYTFSVYNSKDWSEYAKLTINRPISFADMHDSGNEVLIVLEEDVPEQLTRRNLKTGEIIEIYPRINDKIELNSGVEEVELRYTWARYSKDKKSLIAEAGGELLKFDLKDKKLLFRQAHIADIKSITGFLLESADGDKLILKSGTSVNILDGRTGEEKENIYFGGSNLKGFAYNEESNTILVASENEKISIWRDGAIIEKDLNYGRGIPTEIQFLPDGNKVVTSAHENRIIKIIDVNSKLSGGEIPAQIISVSQDASKILFHDGTNFSVSEDVHGESRKIGLKDIAFRGFISEVRSYRISNDGNYIARIISRFMSSDSTEKHFIELYDVGKDKSEYVPLSLPNVGFVFTPDSKQLLVSGETAGLRIVDVQSAKVVKTYDHIKETSYRIMISKDGKTFIVNRISGTSDLYSMETGELIDKIPGEALYVVGEGGQLEVRGLHNNATYRWTKKLGMELFELDEACSDTPVDFGDVNLYNENSDILLMVRNNHVDRVCYVVDFKTGGLLMTFRPSLMDYRINAYLSPDGKTIATDQYFYSSYSTSNSEKNRNYRGTAVYTILGEEETRKEVEQLCKGRKLTVAEKKQIGISSGIK